MKTLGLYLHIPFCLSKCRYCDFYSIPGASEETKERYVNALVTHIGEYGSQAKDYIVTTIYLGGGTPSLLSDKQLKKIIKKIKSCFNVSSKCEISMEVNPGTVDYQKLRAFRKCGVNRISIGIQSFEKADLNICARPHSSDDAYSIISEARKANFDNISIDLIYGLPGQTLQTVVDNVNAAIALDVDHISLYGLKVEDGTPFWFDRHNLSFPDEEVERSMYFNSVGLLANAGFKQYEISNFAKKGKNCRHNLRYWNCDEYIGFGPAAHSYFAGKRFSFKRDVNLYMDSLDGHNTVTQSLIDEYIDIPYSSRIAEYVMLRFRLNTGINVEMFRKKFGRDFDDIYYDRIAPYIKSGHICKTSGGYAFTTEGMYVSNYILSRVVDFDLLIPGA